MDALTEQLHIDVKQEWEEYVMGNPHRERDLYKISPIKLALALKEGEELQ